MNQPKVQLVIMLDEQGGIAVNGPINDKILCYGLLDCARDAIKEFNDKLAKEKSGIAIVPAGAVPNPTRDRRVSFDAPVRNGR